MKTKIATALSIVGVLGAGSAAALVNTQILDSGPTDSGASAAVLPPASSIELTVPTTVDRIVASTADPSTTISSGATTTTTEGAAVAPAAGGSLTAFNVGDAGVVTVDVIDGRLLLVSAEPSPGWSVAQAEDDRNDDSGEVEDEVEVHFTSATVRVEFEAHLVDGQIVPSVESTSIGGTTGATSSPNTVPSGPTANTVHDDDDDHEDDDRDDDDHEDDDRDDD